MEMGKSLWTRPLSGAGACLLSAAPPLVMVLATTLIGAWMFVGIGGPPFIQRTLALPWFSFGPAIMIARGQGFQEVALAECPEVSAFLNQETASLDVARLPDLLPTQALHFHHGQHLYLLYTIGLAWRWFGISWLTLKVLLLAFYTMLFPIAYGLFRLGMNRVLSAAGAMLFLMTPFMFDMVLEPRDFLKAPFILAMMLLIGHVVRKSVKFRALLGLAAALGLVVGVGLGFRHDIRICLIPCIFALACCPRGDKRRPHLQRVAGVVVFLVSYMVFSWPVRNAYIESGTPSHDVVMGLATRLEDRLGLERASYERQYHFRDCLAWATVNAYARRALDQEQPLHDDTPEQEQAGRQLVIDVVKTFPADMLLRAYATVLWVLSGAFWPYPDLAPPPHACLQRYGVLCAVAALLILSAQSTRLAGTVLVLSLYFFGYICIQFQYRHAFHLAFVLLWIVGFLIHQALRVLSYTLRGGGGGGAVALLWPPSRWWRAPALRRMLFFAVAATAAILAPLWAARAYQTRTVSRLADKYAAAALRALEVEARPKDDAVLFHLREPLESQFCRPESHDRRYRDDQLAVELQASLERREVQIVYAASDGLPDSLSWTLTIEPTGAEGTARLFFPVYDTPRNSGARWSRFVGVALPRAHENEFRGLYKVTHEEQFPRALIFTLPADRRMLRPYQTLTWGHERLTRYNMLPLRVEEFPFYRAFEAANLRAAGRYPLSKQLYRDGLTSWPTNLTWLVGLGETLAAEGDWEGAATVFRSGIDSDPAYYVPYRHLYELLLRHCSAENRLAEWREVLGDYSAFGPAHRYLALTLDEAGDTTAAVDALRKAVELDPCDGEAFAILGALLRKAGRTEEAMAAYHAALELRPRDLAIRQRLDELLAERRAG